MLHVCAICPRRELSTGNIHSLPRGGSGHMCVGIFLCIYTFAGPPVWIVTVVRALRTLIQLKGPCHMLKDEQVNKQMMLKEA